MIREAHRLSQLGFVPSKADTSLFIFQHDGVQIFMLVYVDDIVIARSTPAAVDRLVWTLSNTIPIKDLGPLEYFLGLQASYNYGGMTLTQRKYVIDLLFLGFLSVSQHGGQLAVYDSHTSRYFFCNEQFFLVSLPTY
jgi:hypothetical protein